MNTKFATFGAGCFWCVEAVFSELKGVLKVLPGYCGGQTENPSYKDVCSGLTGHAEVCHIEYNPEEISYLELLEVFWKTHDPTTLNRQGGDIGTQYRSAVFYQSDEELQTAKKVLEKLEQEQIWDKPVVTSFEPFTTFWEAEDYHHNYFENNPNQQYCSVVINPKVAKFKKVFADLLKDEK